MTSLIKLFLIYICFISYDKITLLTRATIKHKIFTQLLHCTVCGFTYSRASGTCLLHLVKKKTKIYIK